MGKIFLLLTILCVLIADKALSADRNEGGLKTKEAIRYLLLELKNKGIRPRVSEIEQWLNSVPNDHEILKIWDPKELKETLNSISNEREQLPEIKIKQWNSTFVELIDNALPTLVSNFEVVANDAQLIGVGRDSALVADLLDAYYRSIGQFDKIKVADIGRNSFKDLTILKRYLGQLGLDLANLSNSKSIYFFDSTNFNQNSQSRILMDLIVNMCKSNPKCQLNELFEKIGFINIGTAKGMYKKNLVNAHSFDPDKIKLVNSLAQQYVEIPSIEVPKSLIYSEPFHGPYEGLSEDANGIIYPRIDDRNEIGDVDQNLVIAKQILIVKETKLLKKQVQRQVAKIMKSRKRTNRSFENTDKDLFTNLPKANESFDEADSKFNLNQLNKNLEQSLTSILDNNERAKVLDYFVFAITGIDQNLQNQLHKIYELKKKKHLSEVGSEALEEESSSEGSVLIKRIFENRRPGIKDIKDYAKVIAFLTHLKFKNLLSGEELYVVINRLLARSLLLSNPAGKTLQEVFANRISSPGLKVAAKINYLVNLETKNILGLSDEKTKKHLEPLITFSLDQSKIRWFSDRIGHDSDLQSVDSFYISAVLGWSYLEPEIDFSNFRRQLLLNSENEDGPGTGIDYFIETNQLSQQPLLTSELGVIRSFTRSPNTKWISNYHINIIALIDRALSSEVPENKRPDLNSLLNLLEKEELNHETLVLQFFIRFKIKCLDGLSKDDAFNLTLIDTFAELKRSSRRINISSVNLIYTLETIMVGIGPGLKLSSNFDWPQLVFETLARIYEDRNETTPQLFAFERTRQLFYRGKRKTILAVSNRTIANFEISFIQNYRPELDETKSDSFSLSEFYQKWDLSDFLDQTNFLLRKKSESPQFLEIWYEMLRSIAQGISEGRFPLNALRIGKIYCRNSLMAVLPLSEDSSPEMAKKELELAIHKSFEILVTNLSEKWRPTFITNFLNSSLRNAGDFTYNYYGNIEGPYSLSYTEKGWTKKISSDLIENELDGLKRYLDFIFSQYPGFMPKSFEIRIEILSDLIKALKSIEPWEKTYTESNRSLLKQFTFYWLKHEFDLFVKQNSNLIGFPLLESIQQHFKVETSTFDGALLILWYQFEKTHQHLQIHDDLLRNIRRIEQSKIWSKEAKSEFYRYWLNDLKPTIAYEKDENFMNAYSASSIFRSVWNEDPNRRKIATPGFCSRSLHKLFGR